MPYEMRYEAEHDYIFGRLSGDVDMPVVESAWTQVASVAQEHGCTRVLTDMREANIQMSTTAVYHMPSGAVKFGTASMRRALVVPPGLKDAWFLETVSVNHGQHMKVFTEMDPALDWLLGPPA